MCVQGLALRSLCELFAIAPRSQRRKVAIFDYKPLQAKTGIANRALRPTLGLIDSDHVRSLPRNVAAYSGYDVLCHALESFTAIPFDKREPRPKNPLERPAYQGLYASVCMCVCLSVCLYVSVCLSVCLFISFCVHLVPAQALTCPLSAFVS